MTRLARIRTPRTPGTPATPQTQRLALLDALMGCVAQILAHGPARDGPRVPVRAGHTRLRRLLHVRGHVRGHVRAVTEGPGPGPGPGPVVPATRRGFHNYFVTHLPSSSVHPDSRSVAAHKLPRAASVPHPPGTSERSPAAAPSQSSSSGISGIAGIAGGAGASHGFGRELTVVRIPLRSAKHHFGASSARGSRPYNEDADQAGTIEFPAFAKRAPISLVRSAVAQSRSAGEGITADGAGGDPQIFYFGIFDGHGGTECSAFLRDELHGYIEQTAAEFGLRSTLRRGPPTGDDRAKAETDAARAVALQQDLLQEYRATIGGYFRRFKPASFADGGKGKVGHGPAALSAPSPATPTAPATPATPAPATIESVLTYAFLRADLDFVSAQARKPDPDDPCVADVPLNNDEILGAPHHPPSGHGIGGPERFKGGSTASVALISTPTPAPFWHPAARSTLLVAHVGDTRILLAETATGAARPLTRDHHPSSPVEARRLTRFAESLVTDSFGEERISGLANSRAFGDMQSKRIGVSAEPEFELVELGPAEYSFIVLVSDGVSGTLGDQEIVDVVKEARTPEQGARAVVDYATEVSADGDNATCQVVRLGGWERRSEGGLGSLGTKEIRDARRDEANDPRRRGGR